MHFNWLQLLPFVGHHYAHVATLALVAVVLVLLAFVARVSLGSGEKAVRPASRISVRGFFELIIEFVSNTAEMVIGHNGKKYVPLFASIFVFILFSNIIGLFPGMSAPTDNMNTTLALGLFSFVVFNFYGFATNGLHYIDHFKGPFGFLSVYAPITVLIFAIEIISTCIRPISLSIRLMANMQGDHTVMGIFLGITPDWFPILPIPFYLLGLFVSLLQAFVFMLLSMVYVSMATAHEH